MSFIVDQQKGTVSFFRPDPNGLGINRVFETRECRCVIVALGRSQAFLLCPKHEEELHNRINPAPKDNWVVCLPTCDCLWVNIGRERGLMPCEKHEAAALDAIIPTAPNANGDVFPREVLKEACKDGHVGYKHESKEPKPPGGNS